MRDLRAILWIFALFKKLGDKFCSNQIFYFPRSINSINDFFIPTGVMKIIIVILKFNFQIPDQYSLIKNIKVVVYIWFCLKVLNAKFNSISFLSFLRGMIQNLNRKNEAFSSKRTQEQYQSATITSNYCLYMNTGKYTKAFIIINQIDLMRTS